MAQKEFIDTECDVVFIEYEVNDHGVDCEERMCTREGLIRKLLAEDMSRADCDEIYTGDKMPALLNEKLGKYK